MTTWRPGAQPDLRPVLPVSRAASRARCSSHGAGRRPDILTFDMGGTSTDVSLCRGQPTIGRETSIGHFRVNVPSVNVHTVGAGGGSIAHVPPLTGALRVGPQSPGAEPGPAAYGRGGTEPTVTDANVVVATCRAPARRRDGARRRRGADRGAADRRRHGPLGSRRPPRASSIVNENMAGALRVSRCSAGTTRASSPWWPSAAPGCCTPTRSPADGLVPGHRAAVAGPAVRARRPRGRVPHEFAQTLIRLPSEASDAELRAILGDLGRGRASGWSRRASPKERPARRVRRRHALPRPGLRDPGSPLGATAPRGALQRAPRAALRLPHAHTAPEIVNLRAVGTGRPPATGLPESEPSPGEEHASSRQGTLRCATSGTRACRSPAPRSSPSSTPRRSSFDGYRAEIDRHFNLLITPAAGA